MDKADLGRRLATRERESLTCDSPFAMLEKLPSIGFFIYLFTHIYLYLYLYRYIYIRKAQCINNKRYKKEVGSEP